MLVKFRAGANAYGLGYAENEIAEVDEKKKVETQILATLVDKNNNPVGQKWVKREFTYSDLFDKGVAVTANEVDARAYRDAKKDYDEAVAKDPKKAGTGFVFVAKVNG